MPITAIKRAAVQSVVDLVELKYLLMTMLNELPREQTIRPLRSLSFRGRIGDEVLRELVAPGEIVSIERGSWLCNVRFYSDEHVNDVDRRIKAWYENWQKIEKARHEAEWAKMY